MTKRWTITGGGLKEVTIQESLIGPTANKMSLVFDEKTQHGQYDYSAGGNRLRDTFNWSDLSDQYFFGRFDKLRYES